jgi:large subunit ribosomal protein L29
MKYKEINDLDVIELKKRKGKVVEELFQIKMKNQLGQLANPLQIRLLRREVAKIQTALSHKAK